MEVVVVCLKQTISGKMTQKGRKFSFVRVCVFKTEVVGQQKKKYEEEGEQKRLEREGKKNEE